MQLISLAPAPIRAFAEMETFGPICYMRQNEYYALRNVTVQNILILTILILIPLSPHPPLLSTRDPTLPSPPPPSLPLGRPPFFPQAFGHIFPSPRPPPTPHRRHPLVNKYCMGDPDVDHGFYYDEQGRVNILNSPFFDVSFGNDPTAEDYVERITYQLTLAIEEQIPTGRWCLVSRRPTSPASTSSPATLAQGVLLLLVASLVVLSIRRGWFEEVCKVNLLRSTNMVHLHNTALRGKRALRSKMMMYDHYEIVPDKYNMGTPFLLSDLPKMSMLDISARGLKNKEQQFSLGKRHFSAVVESSNLLLEKLHYYFLLPFRASQNNDSFRAPFCQIAVSRGPLGDSGVPRIFLLASQNSEDGNNNEVYVNRILTVKKKKKKIAKSKICLDGKKVEEKKLTLTEQKDEKVASQCNAEAHLLQDQPPIHQTDLQIQRKPMQKTEENPLILLHSRSGTLDDKSAKPNNSPNQSNAPNRNFEFIRNSRYIKSKLPFLIKPNKINLSQVWNLQFSQQLRSLANISIIKNKIERFGVYSAASRDRMMNHRLSRKRKQWLRNIQRQRPEPRPCIETKYSNHKNRQIQNSSQIRVIDVNTFCRASNHNHSHNSLFRTPHCSDPKRSTLARENKMLTA
ncbi:hypothetical protein M5K25_008908 [Dendrobium thyrsiflorum]|uniref:Uncharacterized protein n=1 Tax=Dendrobium thyrsiflorum TaxID=117978 RepID=A0ABD0V9A5_DENTH